MKKLIIPLLLLAASCDKVVEPITKGKYFVTNNTSVNIVLETDNALLASTIAPSEKIHIYTFMEGSGGHVRPSNAFSTFKVYSETIAEVNIIYNEVDDNDWEDEGIDGEGFYIYNLVVE